MNEEAKAVEKEVKNENRAAADLPAEQEPEGPQEEGGPENVNTTDSTDTPLTPGTGTEGQTEEAPDTVEGA